MNITSDNLAGMIASQTNLTLDESKMAINALSEIMMSLFNDGCRVELPIMGTFEQIKTSTRNVIVGFPPK